MNYRHKPHKDKRPNLSAAELQQKVAEVRNLTHDFRDEIKKEPEPDIKQDFGQVIVNSIPDRTNIRKHIGDFMESHGFNVNACDICSLKEDGTAILFKFVHWSVPTMATEPYYRIEFIIKL